MRDVTCCLRNSLRDGVGRVRVESLQLQRSDLQRRRQRVHLLLRKRLHRFDLSSDVTHIQSRDMTCVLVQVSTANRTSMNATQIRVRTVGRASTSTTSIAAPVATATREPTVRRTSTNASRVPVSTTATAPKLSALTRASVLRAQWATAARRTPATARLARTTASAR